MELSLIHILNRTDCFFYKTEHTITSQNKKRYCYYSLPVSYTHLDVYKRQDKTRVLVDSLLKKQLPHLRLFHRNDCKGGIGGDFRLFSPNLQMFTFLCGSFFPQGDIIDTGQRKPCFLDVYKRQVYRLDELS